MNEFLYFCSESFDGTNEEKEYLRAVKDAARAKALTAKFEEWEKTVGEDGGYTNLVDENGLPLETASKLKNRYLNTFTIHNLQLTFVYK